jgi:glycosyltransferase involved in cell wall biosynthesis
MRILFVQHGDFAEAWRRFRDGEPETYRDQWASVDFVAGLARGRDVVVVTLRAEEAYDTVLAPGLRAIGAPDAIAFDMAAVKQQFDAIRPNRIVCRAPHLGTLVWSRRNGVPTLPCFADTFQIRGVRGLRHLAQLRWLLGDRAFPCVANHSLNASRSLAWPLLYPRDRIVPWDWSRLAVIPAPLAAIEEDGDVFYAGALKEAKGIGDIIEAARLLKEGARPIRFTVAGGGDADIAAWRAIAARSGVEDVVTFLGRLPHPAVRDRMTRALMVVVPSRHDYAEGLPNVIYEALAARAPLLISDHPAFSGRVAEGRSASTFRAGDPVALAAGVAKLAADAALRTRMRAEAAEAHDALYLGLEWSRLIETFLSDPTDKSGWVRRNSLAALERSPCSGERR